jgi:hypothetical protein
MRHSARAEPGTSIVRITLEAPDNLCLVTNFIKFHFWLNGDFSIKIRTNKINIDSQVTIPYINVCSIQKVEYFIAR